MTAIIEVRDLVKQYPKTRAVDGIDLAISEGVCFGLLGPNGAGKSTTIEMIEGMIAPTSGTVLYRGEALGRKFREKAGIQFQSTALQDFQTVRETLPEGFQRSEFLPGKGALDMIVDRRQLRSTIARAVAIMQRQSADAVA